MGTGGVQRAIMRHQMGATYQLASSRVLGTGGERLVELAYHDAANIFAKGFMEAIRSKFAQGTGKVVWEGGKALIRFPLKMSMGMGLGLASSHITTWLIPGNSDFKNKMMFLSFFAPDMARILFGPVQNQAAAFALKSANTVLGAGFFIDLANMGTTKLLYGDDSGYENWVNVRASELKDDEDGNNSIDWSTDWWLGSLAIKALDGALEIIAPQSAADAELRPWILWQTDHPKKIRFDDENMSLSMQNKLRQDIIAKLIRGHRRHDMYHPEFYLSVDFDAKDFVAKGELEDSAYEFMKKRLEFSPTASPSELALDLSFDLLVKGGFGSVPRDEIEEMIERLQRRHMLDQLRFIALPVNDPVRSFADREGRVDDAASFYSFVVGGKTAQDWANFETNILFARKVALTTKLMFAGNSLEAKPLMSVARQIGLIDDTGTWLEPDIYLAAREQWAGLILADAQKHPMHLMQITQYVHEVARKALDPDTRREDRAFYHQELQAVGALGEGSVLAALL